MKNQKAKQKSKRKWFKFFEKKIKKAKEENSFLKISPQEKQKTQKHNKKLIIFSKEKSKKTIKKNKKKNKKGKVKSSEFLIKAIQKKLLQMLHEKFKFKISKLILAIFPNKIISFEFTKCPSKWDASLENFKRFLKILISPNK